MGTHVNLFFYHEDKRDSGFEFVRKMQQRG